MIGPRKVTGRWRGVYSYDATERIPGLRPVPFMLILDQGWLGRFTGTVVDDADLGMPGTGAISGRVSYPHIEFTKQMPVAYVRTLDGRKITLREYVIEHEHPCEHDVPAKPVLYRGEFSDAEHVDGTWIIPAGPIPLPGGRAMRGAESTGKWTLEKAAWPPAVDDPDSR